MDEFLKYFLPLYWIAFISIVMVWRIYVVWKRTGVNAYKTLSHVGVHGIVVFYNKWIPFFSTTTVVVYCFFPEYYWYFAPFDWLQRDWIAVFGVIALLLALGLIAVAQNQMGDAWRLAPKDATGDRFVTKQLFAWSRNPIFVGLRLSLVGLFLVLPNAISLAVWVSVWILLSVQVALEEEHLLARHGDVYEAYCRRVRRWI